MSSTRPGTSPSTSRAGSRAPARPAWFYGERRAQFVALRELFDLGAAFPEQVRTVMARGLRTGDLLTAHRQLQTLVDTAPSDAALAHQRLDRDAPTLFGLFGAESLPEDPTQADAATRSFTTMLALAAAMLGLFFVIRTPHKTPKNPPDATSPASVSSTYVVAYESAKTTASTLGQEATQKRLRRGERRRPRVARPRPPRLQGRAGRNGRAARRRREDQRRDPPHHRRAPRPRSHHGLPLTPRLSPSAHRTSART